MIKYLLILWAFMVMAGTVMSQPRSLVVIADSINITSDTTLITTIPKDSEWGLAVMATGLDTTDAIVRLKIGTKIKGYYRWAYYCCDMNDTLATVPVSMIYFEDSMFTGDYLGIYIDKGGNTAYRLYVYLILQKKYY